MKVTYKLESNIINDFFSVNVNAHIKDNEIVVINKIWTYCFSGKNDIDSILFTINRVHRSWLNGEIRTTLNSINLLDGTNLSINCCKDPMTFLKTIESEIIELIISNKYYSIDGIYKGVDGNEYVYVGLTKDLKHLFRNKDNVISELNSSDLVESNIVKQLRSRYDW